MDNNPRKNDEAALKLQKLMGEFGFVVPIVATKEDRTIRAGHTRWKATNRRFEKGELSDPLVPVVFADWDEEKAKRFAIADNKSHEFSNWDEDILRELFATIEIPEDADVVAFTGFRKQEIAELMQDAKEFKDFEDELKDKEGTEDAKITVIVPAKFQETVELYMADGEPNTAAGRGRGLLKKCELL
jgi:ParB-like chromosome segregation protein Spo0J